MEKWQAGLGLGAAAGIIDLVPMLLQGLTWDANLSAFFFWVVCGLFVSISALPFKGAVKGIVVSFVLLVPLAFLIGWSNPLNLVPIAVMTLLLGAGLGFGLEKLAVVPEGKTRLK